MFNKAWFLQKRCSCVNHRVNREKKGVYKEYNVRET